MIKLFKTTVFLILGIFFWGCIEENATEKNVVLSVNAETAISAYLDDITTDIHIIELEFPDGIDLGRINHIKSYKDFILVFDRFQTRKITVFKNDGSFVGQLNKIGRGPGEYLNLDAFALDYINERLIVYERQNGLYFYSFPELNFIKFHPENRYFQNIEILKNNFLLTVTEAFPKLNQSQAIELMDLSLFTYEKVDLPASLIQTELSYGNTFSNRDNGSLLYASPGYFTNVYMIKDSDFENLFSIDFGMNKIPEDEWKSENPEVFERAVILSHTPRAFWVQNVLFNDEHASFYFLFENPANNYLAICSLKEQDCFTLSELMLADRLPAIPAPLGVMGDYYLSIIYPEEFRNYFSEELFGNNRDWLDQFSSKVKKDNPFILKYKPF